MSDAKPCPVCGSTRDHGVHDNYFHALHDRLTALEAREASRGREVTAIAGAIDQAKLDALAAEGRKLSVELSQRMRRMVGPGTVGSSVGSSTLQAVPDDHACEPKTTQPSAREDWAALTVFERDYVLDWMEAQKPYREAFRIARELLQETK